MAPFFYVSIRRTNRLSPVFTKTIFIHYLIIPSLLYSVLLSYFIITFPSVKFFSAFFYESLGNFQAHFSVECTKGTENEIGDMKSRLQFANISRQFQRTWGNNFADEDKWRNDPIGASRDTIRIIIKIH